ncbi:NAD(P)-binding domain-containing protein [uncultured Sphingomonas sp.]|uniref:NAD(P)-binding domain-containing protein n=1 Tax=uncultured Sphingomonas sp. TaxID=158754 RepID=UPI0035CBAEC9
MSVGLPRVGIVGVGTIAEALVTGMCAGGERRADFLLSPRNTEVAHRLAGRHRSIAIAADNQGVVDGSDIVFLAIRPQVARQVLSPLIFRAEQRIVSLVATFDVERLKPLVAPATTIARAVPLPPVADRLGALTLYPPLPEIAALLDGLGRLVLLDREADIDACLAVTALMGSYFGLLDSVSDWLSSRGLGDDRVRPYVGAIFNALGATAQARAADGFDRLAIEHSTPGGLNEQAWRELKSAGWTGLVRETLDLIHDRVRGQATLDDTLPSNRNQNGDRRG